MGHLVGLVTAVPAGSFRRHRVAEVSDRTAHHPGNLEVAVSHLSLQAGHIHHEDHIRLCRSALDHMLPFRPGLDIRLYLEGHIHFARLAAGHTHPCRIRLGLGRRPGVRRVLSSSCVQKMDLVA